MGVLIQINEAACSQSAIREVANQQPDLEGSALGNGFSPVQSVFRLLPFLVIRIRIRLTPLMATSPHGDTSRWGVIG